MRLPFRHPGKKEWEVYAISAYLSQFHELLPIIQHVKAAKKDKACRPYPIGLLRVLGVNTSVDFLGPAPRVPDVLGCSDESRHRSEYERSGCSSKNRVLFDLFLEAVKLHCVSLCSNVIPLYTM